MAKRLLTIDHFTDPACPYAFSSEPALAALRWHYGEQLEWRTRLVVLSEDAGEHAAKGFDVQEMQREDNALAAAHGMPIATVLRPRPLVSLPADLAIKAVQLHRPEVADRYLRRMRVAWMTDQVLIDEATAFERIAADCEIDPAELSAWIDHPATRSALEQDKAAARRPAASSLGPLDHKLAGEQGARRYTCPSLEITRPGEAMRRWSAPGFENLIAYEVLLANLAPELERRAPAGDPLEVLEWSAWPLAAVEVAAVMGVQRELAESALRESGARCDAAGYWSPGSGDKDQLAAGATATDRLVGGASLG